MRKLESQMRRRASKPLQHKLDDLAETAVGKPVSAITQQLTEIFRQHRMVVSSESILQMAQRIRDGQSPDAPADAPVGSVEGG